MWSSATTPMPDEAALVQAPRGEPDADAVVHQHLQPGGAEDLQATGAPIAPCTMRWLIPSTRGWPQAAWTGMMSRFLATQDKILFRYRRGYGRLGPVDEYVL